MLEESGSAFYYSTKTGEQDITLHHGTVISGAMDKKTMTAFVSKHEIRLIIDAAMPDNIICPDYQLILSFF